MADRKIKHKVAFLPFYALRHTTDKGWVFGKWWWGRHWFQTASVMRLRKCAGWCGILRNHNVTLGNLPMSPSNWLCSCVPDDISSIRLRNRNRVRRGQSSRPKTHPFTPFPAVQPGFSALARRIAPFFTAHGAVNNLRMRRIQLIISA